MRNDEIQSLRNLDFNLLKTLLVLLEHKHISKSAEILFISQPAVSKQLNKLRDMFDDPLLVRTGNQLVLTPKATRLFPLVQNLCQQLRALVLPEELDLTQIEANVSIMCSDYASPNWMTQLLAQVNREAPNVSITCKNWSEENIQKLYKGDINFALGPMVGAESLCESASLGDHENGYIARHDHPLFSMSQDEKSVALKTFPLVKMKGSKRYQQIYESAFEQNVTLIDEVGLWLALETMKTTNAIMVGPKKFVQSLTLSGEFDYETLETLPSIPIAVCWTSGLTSDPFYRWFCDKVVTIGLSLVNQK
ncbi:transcriptional regulator LysR family [Vibrio astriarenae]|nr:transcriptional regulator LysR family [Vibrio sp. C7]